MITFPVPEAPVASVVIIAWKTAPHLDACLRALVAHEDTTPYEVILILNEPTPQLVHYVETKTRGLATITTRVNVGYGGAVNLGAKRARGEFIVLLNDDTTVTDLWLDPLVDLVRRRPLAGAVGSTTLWPDGTIQEAGSVIWADGSSIKVGRDLPHASRRFDYERQVEHCSGTSLLVRRSTWEALGGMDHEAFYPAYYEDTDLCLRVIERGEQVWYQPRSYVHHLESASTNFTYRNFLFERNRAVFVARWRDRLSSHVQHVHGDDAEIAEAIWRAMGTPVRVLVLGDTSTTIERIAALGFDGRCHLELFGLGGLPNRDQLCVLGVATIAGDEVLALEEYLAVTKKRYEIVVDLLRSDKMVEIVCASDPAVAVVRDHTDQRSDETEMVGVSSPMLSRPWREIVKGFIAQREGEQIQ
jgi:GT2 family glycosyltransferase